MLSVILLILKIIGILILSIVGLLILLLLLVLFVPIRYKVSGSYHKKADVEVGVFWLLHILSFRIWYKNGQSGKLIKIFGMSPSFIKKIFKRNNTSKNSEDYTDEIAGNIRIAESSRDDSEENEFHTEPDNKDSLNVNETSEYSERTDDSECTDAGEQVYDNDNVYVDDNDNIDENKFTGIINKIKKFWKSIKKIKFKLSGICDKIKLVFDKAISYKEFLQLDETKEAITFIKEQTWILLKLIKPKTVKGYIDFGTGDPAFTGKLLGLMCLFHIYSTDSFVITPFFEDTILDGEIILKGRITIFSLLTIGIKIYKNDNLKQTISKGRSI